MPSKPPGTDGVQLEFVGMPAAVPAPPRPSTVCPWCREDPCLYDCEEEVRRYEQGDYDDDGWEDDYGRMMDLSAEQTERIRESSWRYIVQREKEHQAAGIPMWDHKPLGRQMENVTVKPGIL